MADKNKKKIYIKTTKNGVNVKTNGKNTATIKFSSKLFIAIFMPPSVDGNPEGDLAVHFLDVGQGDCIIIELPDGKKAIIDAGGDEANTTQTDCETKIVQSIDELKIKTFDYMILSHSDEDHVEFMVTVLEKYDVKQIYRPAFNSSIERDSNINPQYGTIETKIYNKFVIAVQEEQKQGASVEFNLGKKQIDGVGYKFDIFGVSEEWYLKDKVGASVTDPKIKNKVSPMVLLSYNSEEDVRRIMFTGDAEGKGGNNGESLFLNGYNDNIDIDLLKIGHHGSESSASTEFLQRLDPEYAVISVGTQGKHGHPRQECLDRLATYNDGKGQLGIEVYMTKDYGDIIFRVNKQGKMSFDTDIKKAA